MRIDHIPSFVNSLPNATELLSSLNNALSVEKDILSDSIQLMNRTEYIEPAHTVLRGTWMLNQQLEDIDTQELANMYLEAAN